MTDHHRLVELVEQVLSTPGHSQTLGVRPHSIKRGSISLALPGRRELFQNNGFFHGGVIATLADNAGGASVTSVLPEGRFALTISLTVNYLRPACGEMLIAHGRCINVGRTIAAAQIEICCKQGAQETFCGNASAVFRIVDLPTKVANDTAA